MSAKNGAALAALECYAAEMLADCAQRMGERAEYGELDECWSEDWDDALAEAAKEGAGPSYAAEKFLGGVDLVGPAGVSEEICCEAASWSALRQAIARLRGDA